MLQLVLAAAEPVPDVVVAHLVGMCADSGIGREKGVPSWAGCL